MADPKLVALRDQIVALPIDEKLMLAQQLIAHGRRETARQVVRIAHEEMELEALKAPGGRLSGG